MFLITPILVDLFRTFNNGLDLSEILRVLNTIFVDLKVAGINHCIFSNTNYLSSHKIDMDDFVSLAKLDLGFVEFVQLSYFDLDLDRLNLMLPCHLYYDLNYLYRNIFINLNVYKSYGKIIRFYWILIL